MKLPPVDIYRQPFVEPLGHLVMQAAEMDETLVELVALLVGLDRSEVAPKLRNWNDATKQFLSTAAAAASNPEHGAAASRIFDILAVLREHRHRAIHDAVSVGIFGDPAAGYEARALHAGYLKEAGQVRRWLVEVTPDYVAEVAVMFYDLRGDAEVLISQLLPSED